MCKLEGIKWAVVKSHKPISKSLETRLSKIRFGFVQENTFSFYYFEDADFERVCNLLKSYKRIYFEVVKFYDKQFGLTVNHLGYDPAKITEKSNALPLKFRFNWHNHGDYRQTITPITTRQFKNIIKIN
jgi:hypothetical protein